MGSVFLESAFYGDEKTARNVLKVLQDKLMGTTISTKVDDNIIPPFEVVDRTDLSTAEERRIRRQATDACGGVDQQCIESTEARLRQDALAAKQRQNNANQGAIKGKRLTVSVVEVGADGKSTRRKIVIPEGQMFDLKNVAVMDPRKPFALPPLEYYRNQLFMAGSVALAAGIWAFSILATYTVFSRPESGIGLFAIIPTVIAVFVPYSGFAMIFLFYMFRSAVDTYVAM
jgi:hypothetical protein